MNQLNSYDKFPNVFYGKYQVWQLSPIEMDELLNNGWYRQDRHVSTTIGRMVDRQWKPIVFVRIALKDLVWKKKLRKRMRTNLNLFEVHIRPFVPRVELDQLWYTYKTKVHNWRRVVPLADHLSKGLPPDAFNTFELCVRYNGQLVAFSIFDKGEKSIASLEAAYDVNFKKYSLGIFTMLQEIEYCKEENMDYYYPGFYPKDSPMFDYKLRPGNVEFYDSRLGKWRKWESFDEKDWLLIEVLEKLQMVQHEVEKVFTCRLKAFNHFAYPNEKPTPLSYNFLLELRNIGNFLGNPPYKVAWDPIKERYLLFYLPDVPAYESNATIIHSFTPMIFGGYFDDLSDLIAALK